MKEWNQKDWESLAPQERIVFSIEKIIEDTEQRVRRECAEELKTIINDLKTSITGQGLYTDGFTNGLNRAITEIKEWERKQSKWKEEDKGEN